MSAIRALSPRARESVERLGALGEWLSQHPDQSGDTLVLPDGQGTCSEGWSFDASGNVVLCPATCDKVKADATATVELLFGCASGDIPGIR